jgi:hypothetical protein
MNEAARGLSAEAIAAQANRHIEDYLDGGFDLQGEDIAAALAAGVDPVLIEEGWAHAKTLRPKAGPKAASFILPAPQPIVDNSAGLAAKPFIRRRLPAEPRQAEVAPAATKAEPEAAPEPAVKAVEAKPEAAVAEPEPSPPVPKAGVLVDMDAPYEVARRFLEQIPCAVGQHL